MYVHGEKLAYDAAQCAASPMYVHRGMLGNHTVCGLESSFPLCMPIAFTHVIPWGLAGVFTAVAPADPILGNT